MDNSGFNIAEMNDETLQYLLSACEKEMQARKNKDKERENGRLSELLLLTM